MIQTRSKRKLPFYCDVLCELAKKDKLSCPLGRALYACNRRQNGWPSDGLGPYWSPIGDLEFLRKVKHETAVKWFEHWNNGGSIKTLRSQEEQLKLNRERDGQRRRHYKELGIS